MFERSSSGCKNDKDFDKSHDAKFVSLGAKSSSRCLVHWLHGHDVGWTRVMGFLIRRSFFKWFAVNSAEFW